VFPFEVWVNGAEQPRGLGAVAKTLSMDMRANDRAWLAMKLDALAQHRGRRRVRDALPAARRDAQGSGRGLGDGAGGALALRAAAGLRGAGPTPVLDHMFSVEEPRTGTEGTLAWTVDISHPTSGDEFVLGLKEIQMPDGTTRPYSMWLSGPLSAARSTASRASSRSTCA
jgi:ribonucleoside-diphosphate reductase alpha chain